MADVAIRASATASAPRDYTVPGAQEILPKVISARIDGTGAAGSWIPCLQVLDPGGNVMFSAVSGTTIAAGGSADATWFPGVADLATGNLPNPGQGCVTYVAQPTGVAAADTAAIQAAHDSLPATGGTVQLCRGTYALSGDPALAFSKPIQLAGHGKVANRAGASEGYSTTDAATMLQYGSATGTAISVTSTDTFVLRDFGLVNTAVATPPSSGAGISITGVKVSGFQFVGLSVVGFFRCVDVQQGSEWVMHRCYIGDFVQDGLRIQNLTNADYGDMGIMSSYFYRGPHNLGANVGINWQSSGGLRLQTNKFNILGSPGADTSVGVFINPTAAGTVTSDLLIEGNSIENYDFGVATAFSPGAGSTIGNLVVNLNQFLGWTMGCDLATQAAGGPYFTRISVAGNVFDARGGGGGTGLSLQNVDNVTYGPNVYSSGLTTKLSTGGLTNSLQIGNG